jgi:hypothetical protein
MHGGDIKATSPKMSSPNRSQATFPTRTGFDAHARQARWTSAPLARYGRHAMSDADGLNGLSAQVLHDLAVRRAKQHLDVRFFYELMKLLPVAEAGAGELEKSENDIMQLSAHVDDVTDSGRGDVAELMRPFYVDYLRRHHVTAMGA